MPPKLTIALASALLGLATSVLAGGPCEPDVRAVGEPVSLPLAAPQGVAVDATAETIWVVSGLSHTVLQLDARRRVVDAFEAPIPAPKRALTDIAYNDRDDTLLLLQPIVAEVWEVERDGTPTGLVVPLDLPPPVNIIPQPFPRGLAFDPDGDAGRGSLWIVESVMTAVYEVALDGTILESFCHPDDPDGCPGSGKAALARSVELVREDGEVIALELVGGKAGAEVLRRVSTAGEPTGPAFELREIGGSPGGLVRDPSTEPGAPERFFVTVESTAELWHLEVVRPDVPGIESLTCGATAHGVELRWRAHAAYDEIEIRRDGSTLGALPGDAESFTDDAPPDGILLYEVIARREACESRLECTAVVGLGQVRAFVPFATGNPQDITEDGEERLWITTAAGDIAVHGKDLELIATVPSPFAEEDAQPTGIAYDPLENSIYVYDAQTQRIGVLSAETGEIRAAPFPSGYPAGEEDGPYVASMLFDADGAAGQGSFWYLDFESAAIEERTSTGELLKRCAHPYDEGFAAPDGSPYLPLVWGLAAVPGSGFTQLETSAGRVRSPRVERVVRVDTATYELRGLDITLDGIVAVRRPTVLVWHRTTRDGEPVAYALNAFSSAPYLFEIEMRSPPIPHAVEVACSQPASRPDVRLRFTVTEPVDAIEITRDGQLVATLPPEESAWDDIDVDPGVRSYSVRARRDGLRSDDRHCTVRVGPGSLAAHEFVYPGPMAVHQISRDESSGEYIAATSTRKWANELHVYDESLRWVRSFPAPFRDPVQVATLAVRPTRDPSEIWCLGWQPGLSSSPAEFPLRVVDRDGVVLRELTVAPPRPRAPLLTFPSGMAWDTATDSLWYYERNSRTAVNVSPEGEVLGSFARPEPIHQDRVYDFGLVVDGARGVIYLASAGHLEQQITKLVEMTTTGRLTGFEVPVGDLGFYDRPRGFAPTLDGGGFVVASSGNGNVDLVHHRAFGPTAPIRELVCSSGAGDAHLQWDGDGPYDEIRIVRDGETIATLAGTTRAWTDDSAGPESRVYRVAGVAAGLEGAGASCEVPLPIAFLRGDVEPGGTVNLTDAVAILEYLFSGDAEVACVDAADFNDDGAVNITDPVALLNWLFAGGSPPAPPFPLPGRDPTADGLACDQP